MAKQRTIGKLELTVFFYLFLFHPVVKRLRAFSSAPAIIFSHSGRVEKFQSHTPLPLCASVILPFFFFFFFRLRHNVPRSLKNHKTIKRGAAENGSLRGKGSGHGWNFFRVIFLDYNCRFTSALVTSRNGARDGKQRRYTSTNVYGTDTIDFPEHLNPCRTVPLYALPEKTKQRD